MLRKLFRLGMGEGSGVMESGIVRLFLAGGVFKMLLQSGDST